MMLDIDLFVGFPCWVINPWLRSKKPGYFSLLLSTHWRAGGENNDNLYISISTSSKVSCLLYHKSCIVNRRSESIKVFLETIQGIRIGNRSFQCSLQPLPNPICQPPLHALHWTQCSMLIAEPMQLNQ